MCTRIVGNENDIAVVVGRSMDWIEEQPTQLYVCPRGIERDGMSGPNTLRWTAAYGAVLTVVSGVQDDGIAGAADGMNEAGLAGGTLWLSESSYGAFDEARPSISAGVWLQYYLDNFATVAEAVAFTEETQLHVVGGSFEGRAFTVHLALTDPTGDTAVIEYIDGRPQIHHDRRYTVMTNSPPYAEQLANLQRYEGFGGQTPLPGASDAASRFVRAAYYLSRLPAPRSHRECIAGVLGVARNASAPFFEQTNPDLPNVSATRWRTLADTTNRVYFYESTMSPNLVWLDLSKVDFSDGSGVRRLDPSDELIGDCTTALEPSELFTVGAPVLE